MRVVVLLLFVTLSAAAVDAEEIRELTSGLLDRVLLDDLGGVAPAPSTSDVQFLRRVSLDLVGRQPTPAELEQMDRSPGPDARRRVVERLLSSPEFGRHWANYWTDTIRHRVVPPKEVYPDYRPFQAWLADRINGDSSWAEVVRSLITATGRIEDVPAATYLSYHSAEPTKLASETARIFLGLQVGCAECHDHPSGTWTMEQFHGLAAAFAKIEKTRAKGGAVDGVRREPDRQWRMKAPGRERRVIAPRTLSGLPLDTDHPRAALAEWMAGPARYRFARAMVNRVWGELMGRGFYPAIDDLGSGESPWLPRTQDAVVEHVVTTRYGFKPLVRLIVLSQAYQQQASRHGATATPFSAAARSRLRGIEVTNCLEQSLGITLDVAWGARAGSRYRSHRDRVADRFGHDPSLGKWAVEPTLGQSLLLMNNTELQAAIDADSASGTRLARLLVRESDDLKAAAELFRQVLARRMSPAESELVIAHIAEVGDRHEAFEDLLWSLINSTEFLTRE